MHARWCFRDDDCLRLMAQHSSPQPQPPCAQAKNTVKSSTTLTDHTNLSINGPSAKADRTGYDVTELICLISHPTHQAITIWNVIRFNLERRPWTENLISCPLIPSDLNFEVSVSFFMWCSFCPTWLAHPAWAKLPWPL